MSLPEKIYLIDYNQQLIEEWKQQFKPYNSIVEAKACDYFEIPTDAMVSPANSFGFMDGGLDRAICYEVDKGLQEKVQSAIVKKHHGELPIGQAIIVETSSNSWPYLVVAPTMRVPEDVSNSIHAYLAFRAILLEILKHNKQNPQNKINSLVCSGLATGIGKMNAKKCALQMRLAYEHCLNPATILSPNEIYSIHSSLKK